MPLAYRGLSGGRPSAQSTPVRSRDQPSHPGMADMYAKAQSLPIPTRHTDSAGRSEIVRANNNAPFVALRTAKSAVVYGFQGGRVSASACSAGPPWGDGGPTPPRRLAPSGSAIAKSGASVVPSGGSCTNSPGRPPAHSRRSSSRRAQCPHRPTPSRKAAHREWSASESSLARILVTDSWSFGRSRVTVFHTTSRSIST